MGLRFKILSGPLQGKEYTVSPGAVVGRASVEIQISDSKVSGRHAKIEKGPDGALYLIDLGSKSGIRVENKKLLKLPLVSGLTFTLGRTLISVLGDLSADTHDPEPPPLEWFEYFAQFSAQAREKVSNEPKKILPFNKLLVLRFVAGIQAGTEWALGYGPRDIGLGSLDLPLFESSSPPIAFTVSPDPDGTDFTVLYSTRYSEKILLNGRSVSSETLVTGDIISIGETKIAVSFKE